MIILQYSDVLALTNCVPWYYADYILKMSHKIKQRLPCLQAAFSDDRLHPPHHGSGVKIVCNKTFFYVHFGIPLDQNQKS